MNKKRVTITDPGGLPYRREERGWSFYPFQGWVPGGGLPANTHLVSITPGMERGNHFHPGHREYFYAFGGEVLLRWKEDELLREAHIGVRGSLVEIPPGVAHSLVNVGRRDIYVLALRIPEGEGGPETVQTSLPEK